MFSYALARPNETKLLDYLEEAGTDWEEVAKSLFGYLSDNDVKDWAEREGYDIFDEEEEEAEMKKFEVVVHYEGAISYEVEAETEDEAKEIAEEMFGDEDCKTICENMADCFACDCWEEEEE